MYTGVPTLWGADIMTALARGNPHDVLPHTTMQEVLADGVLVPNQPTVPTSGMQVTDPYNYLTDTRDIRVQCICIGNKGHTILDLGGGAPPTFIPKPHLATDAALYGMIPFVCLPIADDLTGSDRARFRLRKTLTINGDLYVAYYGRSLAAPITAPELLIRTVLPDDAGVITSTYVPTVNNQRLVDPDLDGPNEEVYVSAHYVDQVIFTEQDCIWLTDAATLLFGSPYLGFFTEVAVCTGVDKPVIQRYPNSGTQTPIAVNPVGAPMELVAAQPVSFIYAEGKAVGSTGFTIGINTAITEPLYGRET